METRRTFLLAGAGVGLSAVGGVRLTLGQSERPPALEKELVAEFVGVCHRDVDRARELLDREPALIRAAHDWGGGDFETGLGAAAHTGRAPIARLLLDRGAPMDLFAAAMLGELGIVKAVIEGMPEQARALGPHGISLMRHARAGRAEAVVAYLEGVVGE